MNWKTISKWSNRSVYIAAVVAAFIRSVALFSANGNGYFAGILGAIAAEGMTLACYSKIMANEVATSRQKAALIVGTYVGLAISVTIQIAEYWIAAPEMAFTPLGIVAPASATVAMFILITVELTGNSDATDATVATAAATDAAQIEAILGALDVMGQTIATLTQPPQQAIDVAALLQDVRITVQQQMQHERNSISVAIQQMQQALEDMQQSATLQIVAPAGPQQMQQPMQQVQHAEPLRTCCSCNKPIASGTKCSTCRSRDSRNGRSAAATVVAATNEVK